MLRNSISRETKSRFASVTKIRMHLCDLKAHERESKKREAPVDASREHAPRAFATTSRYHVTRIKHLSLEIEASMACSSRALVRI